MPYPKPLSILATPVTRSRSRCRPASLGLVRPTGRGLPAPGGSSSCSGIPRTEGEAVLERLTTVDALPELVAQSSYTRDMPERPLHRLADLAHDVGGVRRATYAEAATCARLVRSLLDGAA